MMARCVFALLAILGCKSGEPPTQPSPRRGEGQGGGDDDDAALDALAARLAADTISTGRPPIARAEPPPSPGDGGAYDNARRVAIGLMAPQAHAPDAVFAVVSRWDGAPKSVRALAADARAGEVGVLVVAGAAAPAAELAGDDAMEWEGVGGIAVASAMQLRETGKTEDAIWQLWAAAQLGFDIARGRRLHEGNRGLSVVRGALGAIRGIALASGKRDLDDAALAQALATCRALHAAHPTFSDALFWDTRWHEQAVASVFAGGAAPRGMTDVIGEDLRRVAKQSGGAGALAAKLGAQRRVADELRAMADKTGAERQAHARDARRAIWGKAHPWAGDDDVGRWEQTHAELAATCVVLAGALERRGQKPDGEPMLDPVGGKPFELQGDRMVGGALVLHGQAAPVEILLPPTRK